MKKIPYALILLVLGLFVLSGCGQTKSPTGNAVNSQVKEFKVKAFRFGYTPDEITVNKGDKIRIVINNSDTRHGMRIPELGVSGNDSVEFVADKQGEFTWYCNSMCGSGHMQMRGKLIVK